MYISAQKHGPALVWTISRPDRFNALGPTIGLELMGLLEELEKQLTPFREGRSEDEPPVRLLIIRAKTLRRTKGAAVWIAGGDLKELASLTTQAEGRAYAELWARILCMIEDMPIPVIAAIQGAAIGGGAELCLAADLRLASAETSLHWKQVEVGLATGYASAKRLIHLVGLAKASELLLFSRQLTAEEAWRCGLLHEVLKDDESLEQRLLELSLELSKLPAKGIQVQKAMLRSINASAAQDERNRELDLFASLWMGPAHKKFIAKYRPSTE